MGHCPPQHGTPPYGRDKDGVCLMAVSVGVLQASPVGDDGPVPVLSSAAPSDVSPSEDPLPPSVAPTDAPSPAPSSPVPSSPVPSTTVPADLSCMLEACPSGAAALVPSTCRCQAYFACDAQGGVTKRLCKPWENFHPTKRACVFWDQVDCTWPASITTRAPPATTQAPPVPGCAFVPECPATGSSKQGIPCPDSCGSYIQCKNGKWTKENCWLKGKFDIDSNKCVTWPWKAKCAA
ncbi:Lysine-specific histone demethylase 2 [Frankliniella fusca]|uniref:Lysine-specific histone demethylase 2 n=1 Tax=Frankliniella fusca TaxID=407009 RepID=A0AAE1HM88_9NEOP|nr:Lysine-specific histone demethylase 2 [Frankliniella fusca]